MTEFNSLPCDACSELLEEFALGELPKPLAAQISQHLSQGCETCNQRLGQIVAGFALAAHAAPSQLPSLRIERQLMQRVTARSSDAVTSSVSRPPKTKDQPPANRIVAVSIVLAASLIGVAAWSTWQGTLPGFSADPSSEATNYQADLQRRIDQAQETQRFSAVPPLNFVSLRRPATGKLVNGYLAIDDAARQWHLYLFNIPTPTEERKYQAWFVIDGQRYIRAGAIDVDADGSASLVLDLPTNISTPSGVAISDEPTAGSDEPSGENFFRAVLP